MSAVLDYSLLAETQNFLTTEQAASLLHLSKPSIRAWISHGKIKARRFGGRWRIPTEEINRLFNRATEIQERIKPARKPTVRDSKCPDKGGNAKKHQHFPLFGFDVDANGKLVPNDDEIKFLQRILDLHKNGYSYKTIQVALTKDGILPLGKNE